MCSKKDNRHNKGEELEHAISIQQISNFIPHQGQLFSAVQNMQAPPVQVSPFVTQKGQTITEILNLQYQSQAQQHEAGKLLASHYESNNTFSSHLCISKPVYVFQQGQPFTGGQNTQAQLGELKSSESHAKGVMYGKQSEVISQFSHAGIRTSQSTS